MTKAKKKRKKKYTPKKTNKQWNLENIDMITIKHLQMDQVLALNKP